MPSKVRPAEVPFTATVVAVAACAGEGAESCAAASAAAAKPNAATRSRGKANRIRMGCGPRVGAAGRPEAAETDETERRCTGYYDKFHRQCTTASEFCQGAVVVRGG